MPEDTGGGGAGDSGGGSDKPGGDEATKTGLSEDQINAIITKTVTRQIKEFAAKQTSTLEAFGNGLFEKLTGTLDEKLAAFQPATPTPGSKKEPATADTAQSSAALKQMQKQLDAATAALAKSEQEKATEKKALRDAKFSSKLDELLTGAGSNAAKLARYALAAEGRVKFRDDDSDELVFVDDDGDEMPANKAVPEWLKSADGMRFMPATGADGSGELPVVSRGAPKTGEKPQTMTKSRLGQALIKHALTGGGVSGG